MESLNRMATELVDEAIDFAEELGIAVHHLDNDAVVVDFGVDTPGGIEAGLLLSEIQTGGLATVSVGLEEVAGGSLPHVELSTDQPLLALLCAAKASWELDAVDGRGSGPARLFVREGPEFAYTDATDAFDFAVLAVEAARLPDADLARSIAERTGVPTSGVFLPTAPAHSIAGSVAIAARAAEVAVFRLLHLGGDPGDVRSVTASAPVPPGAADERTAVVRSNDAIAYGARVHLVVDEPPVRVEELPFEATAYAGESFASILPEDGWSFRDIEGAFAPASVTVDVRGGPTHALGGIDDAALAARLGL